ncbi:MAG: isoamylase early set domain-containing protein [Phaeodactylibacter sp.]|nr:isoamylase early set domain-containing protein [Phaeodactylibacter sp.]MCB9264133.1 isoamylase early set domain-containing protein [Lewinellaceae bacterium]MCB9286753.1 isoamylase early set domain-containing protein [Lewinellaceae bacterium]
MIKKQFLKSKPVCKATFTLPVEAAPEAKSVALVGDFNNWNAEEAVSMKKQKNGVFKAVVELEAGKEYQFRYLIDGQAWENDWEADAYVSTPYGVDNSVISALN